MFHFQTALAVDPFLNNLRCEMIATFGKKYLGFLDANYVNIRAVPKKNHAQGANERVLPTDFRSVFIFFLTFMVDFSFPIKVFKNQRGDPLMKKM